jgi:AraC-like DNA-binding protein
VDRLQFVGVEHRSRYLDTCRRILGVATGQPGVLDDPHVAVLLEETFLETLFLNARVGSSCRHESSRYNLARRAYRYLQDRDDEVPSVRKLCAATGASYATLERSFRETYGLTPKAMMFAMRLSGARRALLHPGPTTTVTAVALRWGFVELGRFAAQYRHRFGEAPSETLRRVRGNPAVERVDDLHQWLPAVHGTAGS